MKKRFLESLSVFLIILLSFPPAVFAGRKHSDVDDIGNRDINGNVALIFPNFVSLEKEIQMGAQYAQFFEQTARLVEDPVVNEYVDRLGQKIVKHSDAKVPFVIKVVDTDEVNAFALPGGYFYVNKGLILESENESELAGVMAHEIAHVAARHASERMTEVSTPAVRHYTGAVRWWLLDSVCDLSGFGPRNVAGCVGNYQTIRGRG